VRRLFVIVLTLTVGLPMVAVVLLFAAAGSQARCGDGGPAGPGSAPGIPPGLLGIYDRAAGAYQLGPQGWAYLAAINYVETRFGQDLSPSSQGAIGWMQFMLWALFTLGFDWEANDFFSFIADVAEGEEGLQVMYGVDGERRLEEHVLEHLGGYEGARPVRIGNDAYRQVQHDVWGSLLDSFYLHTRSRDSLDERVWPILVRQVEAAIDNWRKPDRGIWEVRGEPKHFTSSKVSCWIACDRGARLASIRQDWNRADRWRTAADEIHADILEHGVDGRGVFVQHYDTTALDAAMLLVPLVRFLPPTDERVRSTVFAIADELTEDGLVLRYRPQQTDDGLTGREGTFLICSFWLVSAMSEIGEVDRARDLCERLLGHASPLGLYAEELDPRTGRHLGNFPQAFTHLALINAVMHVIRADQELEEERSPWADWR
jgi:GH15 family glucan-1,4-alpha-glucosidase